MPIINGEVPFQEFIANGDFLKFTMLQPDMKFPTATIDWPSCRATILDSGVLMLEPRTPNSQGADPTEDLKNIVISCGIHGNETAPIEIVNEIICALSQGKIEVRHRVLFIIGNPPAMIKGDRFITENLNRLFKKDHNVSDHKEAIRARRLMDILNDFFNQHSHSQDKPPHNLHYDLHTAIRASIHEKFAIYPFQGNKPWSKAQLSFLQASGINTILFSHAPAGTFSYYTSEVHKADAFTIELGQVKPFGENDMSKFFDISRTLRLLIQNQQIPMREFKAEEFNLFSVCHEIVKTSSTFKFYVDKDIKNFSTFSIGTLLYEDRDNAYHTRDSHEAIVFPNPNVPIGQRVALVIKPMS